MFPIRCYTCNATVAQHHPYYRKGLHEGKTVEALLAECGIRRMCCRRMFIGYVDNMDDQTRFSNTDCVLDANGTRLLRFVKHVRSVACD